MSRELKPEDELQNTYIDERVKDLLPKFEAIAPYNLRERQKGKQLGNYRIQGWEALAVEEVRRLKIRYPDDRPEEKKTYGTCLRQITALKKALKNAAKTELKDKELHSAVFTIINQFGSSLSLQFRQYKLKQTEDYKEEVKERRKKENRVHIDLTDSLKFVCNVLNDIKQGKPANWMDVSCAIALATGRRMGEVHLSASFEQIEDYLIIFKGQLKGKSRLVKVNNQNVLLREAPFEIPTLLPAELICFALQWLDNNGKRFTPNEDPERVNKRFSKTLNKHCKKFNIFPEDERTYHKFRAAYLRACIVNSDDVDPYDFVDYAKEILGDDDENTINSYKRYEIKTGSLTKV